MNTGLELNCKRERKSWQAICFIFTFIMAQILWLAGWWDCPTLLLRFSADPFCLHIERPGNRWELDGAKYRNGKRNGLRRAKMEVTWQQQAQQLSPVRTGWDGNLKLLWKSSMQEAGFQATNAFTGKDFCSSSAHSLGTVYWSLENKLNWSWLSLASCSTFSLNSILKECTWRPVQHLY